MPDRIIHRDAAASDTPVLRGHTARVHYGHDDQGPVYTATSGGLPLTGFGVRNHLHYDVLRYGIDVGVDFGPAQGPTLPPLAILPTVTKDSSPQEVRHAWAERLRAYPERQGQHQLQPSADKRCCLGELVQMASEAGFDVRRRIDGRLSGLLPRDEIREWAGLQTLIGSYYDGPDGWTSSLSGRNDGGASWSEIADIILSEPPGLVIDARGDHA